MTISEEEKSHIKLQILCLLQCLVTVNLVMCLKYILGTREKWRKKDDLQQLNQFIPYQHFKMENLQHVIDMMAKDCYVWTIDLLEIYYCLRVHKDFLQILKNLF